MHTHADIAGCDAGMQLSTELHYNYVYYMHASVAFQPLEMVYRKQTSKQAEWNMQGAVPQNRYFAKQAFRSIPFRRIVGTGLAS